METQLLGLFNSYFIILPFPPAGLKALRASTSLPPAVSSPHLAFCCPNLLFSTRQWTRRRSRCLPYVLPPLALGYAIITCGQTKCGQIDRCINHITSRCTNLNLSALTVSNSSPVDRCKDAVSLLDLAWRVQIKEESTCKRLMLKRRP